MNRDVVYYVTEYHGATDNKGANIRVRNAPDMSTVASVAFNYELGAGDAQHAYAIRTTLHDHHTGILRLLFERDNGAKVWEFIGSPTPADIESASHGTTFTGGE